MLSWSIHKAGILLSVLAGFILGFLLLQSLPLAVTNLYILAAVPLALCVLLAAVINLEAVFILIIFSRALLDPLLESTKVAVAGDSMGLGGILNVMVILLGVTLALRHPKAVFKDGAVQRWLLFLAVCMVSIWYSPVRGKGIKLFLYFASYASMMVISFCLVHDLRSKKFWMGVLMLSCLLPVGFADFDLIRGGAHYAAAGFRIQGTFSHPNILAFFLVFAVMLAFYSLKSKIFKLNGYASIGLKLFLLNCLVLLVATKTRNAWIACWLFFAVYGLLKEKKYLWFSLFLPPLALLSPQVLERALDLLQGTGSNPENELNSFSWRLELWKRSLVYAQDKLMFGYGLNSFRPLSSEFFETGAGGVPAHNTYVQMLFEAGVIGVLMYASIFWNILKTFIMHIKKTVSWYSIECSIAAAYLFSYAFSCAGDNLPDYIAFNWYVWFFVGIMLKTVLLSHEKNIGYYSVV